MNLYLVHIGTGTIIDVMDDCKLVTVFDDNREANLAVEDNDIPKLLRTADKVEDAANITLWDLSN